jgi:hypothetical protein
VTLVELTEPGGRAVLINTDQIVSITTSTAQHDKTFVRTPYGTIVVNETPDEVRQASRLAPYA